MQIKKENWHHYLPYALMAVFYCFIAYCIPYCHDDWDWGLDIGITQWLNATLNSRYVGNFFVVAMTRSPLVKTLVISLSLFIIPVLIGKLTGKRDIFSYLLTNLAILIVPKLMWQQTYGWVSAFANYVVAVVFLLLLLVGLDTTRTNWNLHHYLLLPLTFSLMLFTENVTVAVVIGLTLFVLIECIAQRKIHLLYLGVWISGMLGAVVMFSNQLYGALITNGVALGGIRSVDVNLDGGPLFILLEISSKYVFETLPPLFFNHRWLVLLLVVSLLFGASKRKPHLYSLLALPMVAILFIVLFQLEIGDTAKGIVSFTLFYLVSVCILLFYNSYLKMFSLWLLAFLVLLPLTVVTEIGPRLYYLPYILVLCVAMMALPTTIKYPKLLTGAALSTLLLTLLFYCQIYTLIHSVTVTQRDAIALAVAEQAPSVILVKEDTKYWWGRNPASENRLNYFKEFYGIPPEMDVEFVFYDET